jgi:hypothetical protein
MARICSGENEMNRLPTIATNRSRALRALAALALAASHRRS